MVQRARLPHVPRLSIAYFMAWTAVTSAILAVTVAGRSAERLWTIDWTHAIASSFYSTVAGWILLGSLLIAWHAMRRTLWRLEPGEWLLLGLLAVVVANWVDAIWFEMMFPRRLADPYQYESFESLRSWLRVRHLTLSALVAVAYVAAVLIIRREGLWAAAIAAATPGMALCVTKFSSL